MYLHGRSFISPHRYRSVSGVFVGFGVSVGFEVSVEFKVVGFEGLRLSWRFQYINNKRLMMINTKVTRFSMKPVRTTKLVLGFGPRRVRGKGVDEPIPGLIVTDVIPPLLNEFARAFIIKESARGIIPYNKQKVRPIIYLVHFGAFER